MEENNACNWGFKCQEEIEYHNNRWCKPVHDDNELFAMLCLEGQQAGLSWSLIVKREKAIRQAYDNFIPEINARYDEDKILELKNNPQVIRNGRKIQSVITNAQEFLKVQQEYGSFDKYIWGFTGGETIVNHPEKMSGVPVSTELSEKVSHDLKKRGFKFVGEVIIYSYLQAIGIVNDHLDGCPYKY